MTKTERDELRRVIRARFKVLRNDVEQRRAELHAATHDRAACVWCPGPGKQTPW